MDEGCGEYVVGEISNSESGKLLNSFPIKIKFLIECSKMEHSIKNFYRTNSKNSSSKSKMARVVLPPIKIFC